MSMEMSMATENPDALGGLDGKPDSLDTIDELDNIALDLEGLAGLLGVLGEADTSGAFPQHSLEALSNMGYSLVGRMRTVSRSLWQED